MFFYSACGLIIQSELALPELVASEERKPEVTISRRALARPDSKLEYGFDFVSDERQVRFDWQQVGAFVVDGNDQIWVHANESVEASLVRIPLLGVVLATLLHRRGFLVLHGSAALMAGKAVAFIGDKGMGKSTTTVAMYKAGHVPLTDDIVAINCDNPLRPMIYPSFPQIKLWPEVARSLGEDPETLPELSKGFIKRAYSVKSGFNLEPLPLEGIYVLAFGSLAIQPLEPQQALKELIAHSYCTRFGTNLLGGAMAYTHLHQCSNVINQIPMRKVEREYSLDSLPLVIRLLEDDVKSS